MSLLEGRVLDPDTLPSLELLGPDGEFCVRGQCVNFKPERKGHRSLWPFRMYRWMYI